MKLRLEACARLRSRILLKDGLHFKLWAHLQCSYTRKVEDGGRELHSYFG
jgi:hypothetical protein